MVLIQAGHFELLGSKHMSRKAGMLCNCLIYRGTAGAGISY